MWLGDPGAHACKGSPTADMQVWWAKRGLPASLIGPGLLLCVQEMASRHRVRAPCLQIIKTATVPAALTKRVNVKQFHDSKIQFPLTRRMARCAAAVALSWPWRRRQAMQAMQ